MDLNQIKKLASGFASDLSILQSVADDMQADLDKIAARYSAPLESSKKIARASRDRLRRAIESAPDLFVKPRTQEHQGIEFGFRKLKGKIIIEDVEKTLTKIKDSIESPWDYIRTIEEPDKKALEKLPAADLKKLGVAVKNDTDAVVVRQLDGEREKQTNDLLDV
jgi:sirohydrochlorin ferrochelatase